VSLRDEANSNLYPKKKELEKKITALDTEILKGTAQLAVNCDLLFFCKFLEKFVLHTKPRKLVYYKNNLLLLHRKSKTKFFDLFWRDSAKNIRYQNCGKNHAYERKGT
jgi:hypothetical protein